MNECDIAETSAETSAGTSTEDGLVKLWHGRHVGPLLTVWVVILAIAAGLRRMESSQPALSELLIPLYVILAVLFIAVTWKWFRERARGNDRRHQDRRHTDRRD